MVRFFRNQAHICAAERSVARLTIGSVAGMTLGAYLATFADSSVLSMIPIASAGNVTPVHLLTVIALPFLFTFYAFYVRQFWILTIISVLKGLCFGFCGGAIYIFYGNSGWLMQSMLMFSDILSMGVLFWFWIHSFRVRCRYRGFCIALAMILWIVTMDIKVIIPFFNRLLS